MYQFIIDILNELRTKYFLMSLVFIYNMANIDR